MKENTLWVRLLPQAREVLIGFEMQFPATTKDIIKHLKDDQYISWTELPYHIVKMIHERVFGAGSLELIEEDEIRTLFENYYD